MNERFLLERMERFFADVTDPWHVGYQSDLIASCGLPEIDHYVGLRSPWPAVKHAARVLFMVQNDDERNQPITIDCDCSHGRVWPIPIIVDGWHRYLAHRWLQSRWVPVSFSGRVDLAQWLAGVRRTCPED